MKYCEQKKGRSGDSSKSYDEYYIWRLLADQINVYKRVRIIGVIIIIIIISDDKMEYGFVRSDLDKKDTS